MLSKNTHNCQPQTVLSNFYWNKKMMNWWIYLDVKIHPCSFNWKELASWWFQPLWNILVEMGSSSPSSDENKKYLKPPTRLVKYRGILAWLRILKIHTGNNGSNGCSVPACNADRNGLSAQPRRWRWILYVRNQWNSPWQEHTKESTTSWWLKQPIWKILVKLSLSCGSVGRNASLAPSVTRELGWNKFKEKTIKAALRGTLRGEIS